MFLDQGVSVFQAKKNLTLSTTVNYHASALLAPATDTMKQKIDYRSGDLWILAFPVVREKNPTQWLEANREAMRNYAGEWLLITADGLMTHSACYRDIRSAVQKNKPTDYITYYVPRPEETNFSV